MFLKVMGVKMIYNFFNVYMADTGRMDDMYFLQGRVPGNAGENIWEKIPIPGQKQGSLANRQAVVREIAELSPSVILINVPSPLFRYKKLFSPLRFVTNKSRSPSLS